MTSSNPLPIREFTGWRHVPKSLKTKSRWKRNGRQVRKDENPVAVVHEPRFLEEGEDVGTAVILEKDSDNTLVTDYEVALYSIEQTDEYTPSDYTRLAWAYCDLFLTNARRDYWVRKLPRPETCTFESSDADWGNKDWCFMSPTETVTNRGSFTSGLLNETEIKKHLAHKQTVGVCNDTGYTSFVAIDHDYHGRNLDVFLEMSGVLLRTFNTDTWFPAIRNDVISGLNFFRVFPPQPLADVVLDLRGRLIALDVAHPDLAERARQAGMKSFGTLEIYPTRPDCPVERGNSNNCRLPLGHGRIIAIDRWIQPKSNSKQPAPLKELITWLKDPHRQHMDPDNILQTIRVLAFEQTDPLTCDKPIAPSPIGIGPGRKGREKDLLIDFWINGRSHDTSLDAQLLILARHAYFYGYRVDQANYLIGQMVRSLPKDTDCNSRKLKAQDWPQINSSVKRAVDLAYTGNSHQPLTKRSTAILTSVANNFHQTGFDPLNSTKWLQRSIEPFRGISFSGEQKAHLLPKVAPFFKYQDPSLTIIFLEELVCLVYHKETHRWGDGYFTKWVKQRFPQLKLGKKQKRTELFRLLIEIGLIVRVEKGTTGRPSIWKVGNAYRYMFEMLTDADNTPNSSESTHAALLMEQAEYSTYDQ